MKKHPKNKYSQIFYMIIVYIHPNPVRMTEHLTEIWVGSWVGA